VRWLTLLMVVALVGCSAQDRSPAAVAVPAEAPTATPEPTPTPAPAPVAAPQLENPVISVGSGTIPFVPSLTLRSATVSADVVTNVNQSLGLYLTNLNGYRDSGFDGTGLHLTGAFRDAVIAGLKGSATPGVKRKLALESVRVDRYLVKPWGTPALAEATATIVDRAIDGSAPDQRETGRLRLTGQRLRVDDAWDGTRGTWFNGPARITSERSAAEVKQALVVHLRSESWVAGAPAETYFGSAGETPYQTARAAYLAAFDRTAIASRTFEGVTAVIERYDGFAEIADGLATVGVTGTVVVKDRGGATTRSPFRTRVVVLFGNWTPEVIDEELSAGIWRSAGDRALSLIDVSRA